MQLPDFQKYLLISEIDWTHIFLNSRLNQMYSKVVIDNVLTNSGRVVPFKLKLL